MQRQPRPDLLAGGKAAFLGVVLVVLGVAANRWTLAWFSKGPEITGLRYVVGISVCRRL